MSHLSKNTETKIYSSGEPRFNVAVCNVQLTQLTTGLHAKLTRFICQSTLYVYSTFLCTCFASCHCGVKQFHHFLLCWHRHLSPSRNTSSPPLLLAPQFFSPVPSTQSVIQSSWSISQQEPFLHLHFCLSLLVCRFSLLCLHYPFLALSSLCVLSVLWLLQLLPQVN